MTYGERPSPARLKAGRAWLRWVRRDAQLYEAYHNAPSARREYAKRNWLDHLARQPRPPADDVLRWIREND